MYVGKMSEACVMLKLEVDKNDDYVEDVLGLNGGEGGQGMFHSYGGRRALFSCVLRQAKGKQHKSTTPRRLCDVLVFGIFPSEAQFYSGAKRTTVRHKAIMTLSKSGKLKSECGWGGHVSVYGLCTVFSNTLLLYFQSDYPS